MARRTRKLVLVSVMLLVWLGGSGVIGHAAYARNRNVVGHMSSSLFRDTR